jgi:hypothetical protein
MSRKVTSITEEAIRQNDQLENELREIQIESTEPYISLNMVTQAPEATTKEILEAIRVAIRKADDRCFMNR